MGLLRKLVHRFTDHVPLLRYHILLNQPVRMGSAIIKVPVIEGQHPQHQGYEPWMLSAIERIFALRQGAFIDIGANRGQTLIKVIAVDRERRYIGFEPNIACADFVERIIRINHLRNHTILALGLSDDAKPIELFLSKKGTESSTTAPGVRGMAAYHGSKHVFVQTGDSVLEQLAIDAIAVLKIDIEGAELEAFRGLTRTIERHKPWVIFEVLPPSLIEHDEVRRQSPDREAVISNNKGRAARLEQLLDQIEYRFWNILPSGSLRSADHLDMGPEMRLSNFIATPRADEPLLLRAFGAIPS